MHTPETCIHRLRHSTRMLGRSQAGRLIHGPEARTNWLLRRRSAAGLISTPFSIARNFLAIAFILLLIVDIMLAFFLSRPRRFIIVKQESLDDGNTIRQFVDGIDQLTLVHGNDIEYSLLETRQ